MNIMSFNHNHIVKAKEIAMANYEEERQKLPYLPRIDEIPDLNYFADNQLGVTAFEGDQMLGFLCAYQPSEDAFGTTNVRGTFSPIHAHGVISSCFDRSTGDFVRYDRDRIYSRLYQEAAKRWVEAGIKSHAIALYTHEKDSINSFFYNSFGLRCMDAVRSLDTIPEYFEVNSDCNNEIEYCELRKEEWRNLTGYHNGLISHLGNSPCFMRYDSIEEEDICLEASEGVRYFAAKAGGEYIVYLKISDEGENFITEYQGMKNICGAYCKPSYRGTGISHNLLCYLMKTLKREGYELLGVDCESFNPTARSFWLKYFTEYTNSMVRRIDDKVFL